MTHAQTHTNTSTQTKSHCQQCCRLWLFLFCSAVSTSLFLAVFFFLYFSSIGCTETTAVNVSLLYSLSKHHAELVFLWSINTNQWVMLCTQCVLHTCISAQRTKRRANARKGQKSWNTIWNWSPNFPFRFSFFFRFRFLHTQFSLFIFILRCSFRIGLYVCTTNGKCNVYMHSMIHLMFCHSLNKLNENSLRCCVMERKTYIFVYCNRALNVSWLFVLCAVSLCSILRTYPSTWNTEDFFFNVPVCSPIHSCVDFSATPNHEGTNIGISKNVQSI